MRENSNKVQNNTIVDTFSPYIVQAAPHIFELRQLVGKGEIYVLNALRLDELSKVELKDISIDSLVDIASVKIDRSLPLEKRIINYLEQVKNPYCFRFEETIVKIRYRNDAKPLDSAVKRHFLGLKGL